MKILGNIPDKVRASIREKAIQRANTRIIIAGRNVADLSEQELEIVVKEEEDKLISGYKEKGLLAVIGILGLGLWI